MKICLIGTQGTGKSTLLNRFRDHYNVIDGVARRCITQGCDSSESGTWSSQCKIFNSYLRALDEENYISTRSVLDVLAYTAWLTKKGKIIPAQYLSQLQDTVLWWIRNPEVVICYVPIEFEIEDDGVRSVDKTYQKEIDKEMLYVLQQLKVPYYSVSGTVEQRVEQLKEIIQKIESHGVSEHKINN